MSLDFNIQTIQHNIHTSLTHSENPAKTVTLVAVSKMQTVAAMRQVFANGVHDFGENYWQEADRKMQELRDLPITWHMIGDIQSNKAKMIAEKFDWVHTVCREKIAERLNQYRPSHLSKLNICIEINIDREPTKSGIKPEELIEFANIIKNYPNLNLRGLMCIPAKNNADAFTKMNDLYRDLIQQGFALDTLSMGMSADYQQAIAAGATMVRVGTALFGERE